MILSRRGATFAAPFIAPLVAILGASAALIVAWISQYGFGLAPCELCYWQRYGYGAAIAIGFLAFIAERNRKKSSVGRIILSLAFFATAAIALFHAGVEYHWWQGFTSCTGNLATGGSVEDLLAAIEQAPIVRCDEPAFLLFGISMAGYDFFYAFALGAFCLWSVGRRPAS